MNWAFSLILIPTLCYAGAAGVYAMRGDAHLAVVYLGYAVANCGFLWMEVK